MSVARRDCLRALSTYLILMRFMLKLNVRCGARTLLN